MALLMIRLLQIKTRPRIRDCPGGRVNHRPAMLDVTISRHKVILKQPGLFGPVAQDRLPPLRGFHALDCGGLFDGDFNEALRKGELFLCP